MFVMERVRSVWLFCACIAALFGVVLAANYYLSTKAFYSTLNPGFFCSQCEVSDTSSFSGKSNTNATYLNQETGLFNWKQNPAVMYFVMAQAYENQQVDITIQFPIKDTILVLSSDTRVTFNVKFSSDYTTYSSKVQRIISNGPFYNAVNMNGFTVNTTYLCDDGDSRCIASSVKSSSTSYVWSQGGSELESKLQGWVGGLPYTTFVGCERAKEFSLRYDGKDGCEPLSGGAIAGIVIGVVVPVVCCLLGVCIGILRVCLSSK